MSDTNIQPLVVKLHYAFDRNALVCYNVILQNSDDPASSYSIPLLWHDNQEDVFVVRVVCYGIIFWIEFKEYHEQIKTF